MTKKQLAKRKWNEDNAAHVREYNRKRRTITHIEQTAASMRAWRKKQRPKLKVYGREYYRRNAKRLRIWAAKRRANPSVRLRNNCSRRMWRALKGKTKRSDTAMAMLGCTLENFWLYLESKFEPGMTRENYGAVWEVDHIMPCAIFDLTQPEHQRRCFHFSNLQPLFVADNRSKWCKVPTKAVYILHLRK